MSAELLKIRQLREARKIIEMLVRISLSENLPEIYAPDDFRLTEEYIEPPATDDDYAASKIEIKDRYFISPALLKKPGAASRKNGKNLLGVRGWLLVEAVELKSDAPSDDEPAIEWRDVGAYSSCAEVVKAILLNDARTVIDEALYILSQVDAEVSPDEFALESGEAAAV